MVCKALEGFGCVELDSTISLMSLFSILGPPHGKDICILGIGGGGGRGRRHSEQMSEEHHY